MIRRMWSCQLTVSQNNTLVSGDNKGMAAYLYEHLVEPDAMPGNNTFVAGFTQCAHIILYSSPKTYRVYSKCR